MQFVFRNKLFKRLVFEFERDLISCLKNLIERCKRDVKKCSSGVIVNESCASIVFFN